MHVPVLSGIARRSCWTKKAPLTSGVRSQLRAGTPYLRKGRPYFASTVHRPQSTGRLPGGEFLAVAPLWVVPSDFQQLRVYRLAVALSDEIYAAVERWPNFAKNSLGWQLIRSVDSIGANIAEASGRHGPADRRRFLIIARGSLYETEHWIGRAEARGLLPHGSAARLDEIGKPLSGLIRRPV